MGKMPFTELVNVQPNVRVCDIIQLFLLGYDYMMCLNLQACNEFEGREYYRYILKSERIIHDEWQPYYECKVMRIEEECTEGTGLGYLTLVI